MSFDEQPDGDIHGECAAEIRQLEIALRIKTEEHDCCAKDLLLWRTSYERACTQNVHLCAKIDDCRPFLKEGESPAEGLARFRTKITEVFGRWTLFMDEQKLKDAACRPYLKEGETVADALERMQKESTILRNKVMQTWGCKPCDWMPIESAPRDGTQILGWCGEYVDICYFYKKHNDGYVWMTAGCADFGGHESPTHWMPLPAAPTTKGAT